MRNDGAGTPFSRELLAHTLGNKFIRQAVKSVAPESRFVELLGDGVVIGNGRVTSVKGRIEAGDLGQLGIVLEQCPDRRKVVRLMQGSERNIPIELIDDCGINQNWLYEFWPTMHHAVSNRDQVPTLDRAQPVAGCSNSTGDIAYLISAVRLVDQNCFIRSLRTQMRLRANTIHLAPDDAFETRFSVSLKNLEFHAR